MYSERQEWLWELNLISNFTKTFNFSYAYNYKLNFMHGAAMKKKFTKNLRPQLNYYHELSSVCSVP